MSPSQGRDGLAKDTKTFHPCFVFAICVDDSVKIYRQITIGVAESFPKTSAQFKISSGYQILYALENHIGIFMDIFIYESARRIGDQNVLRKVDALMDWSMVSPLLKAG